ncbi:MAG: ABC transporter ATP-binding protein [Alphaproteobacteria bacterium]|nr:ABC transporter ATP-binding protein [Alphaproteobacteria bacterium]
MTSARDVAVEVIGLSKNYGAVRALASVDLKIAAGEYFVLLGPSGGGKTTLLRLLGGFIRPSAGTVLLHGHDVSALPPNRRPTSMVFQSYALFPHMSVARNVGYGLKLQNMPKAEAKDRIAAMLELVGLTGYDARMPHELSGGQQQRVQLARSLVLERDVLLLDEPLAALDAKLRKDMCLELKHIQEKVGITFVHVTHNQEEAMTVADRLAIIAEGELIEAGTARDVYERPIKRFTADFVGERAIFDGTVASAEKTGVQLDLGFGTIAVKAPAEASAGAKASVSIRSELLELLPAEGKAPAGFETLEATYRESVYLGLTISHVVSLPDGSEIAVRDIAGAGPAKLPEAGAPVRIGWKAEDASLHLS